MAFGGGGGSSIQGSSDVTLSSPQTNDILIYNGGTAKWQNQPVPEGLHLRGEYTDSTAYAVGDVVSYNGGSYAALVAVPSTNTTAPVDGATWQLIAAPGADGADSTVAGPQGNNGIVPLPVRAPNPAQGMLSDKIVIGPASTLVGITLAEDSPGPSSQIVLQAYRDVGAGNETLYTTLANRPTLPGNATESSSMAVPDVSDLPTDSTLQLEIVTCPSGGVTSPSPGTPTGASSNGTSISSVTASIPFTMPTGVQAGDLLIATVTAMTTIALPTSDGSGASNGWLTLENAYTGATNSLTLLVIYKTAQSSNDAFPSSFTFGATSRYAYGCIAVTNFDPVTPTDSNSSSSTNATGTINNPVYSAQFPTITPGVGGETILYLAGLRANFAYNDGIVPVGPGTPVIDGLATNGSSNNGSNVGIYIGYEAGPATAGTATTARSVGQQANPSMSNAPAQWQANTAYAANATVWYNDASGVPQIWKNKSGTTVTSATAPPNDSTNWIRSGYDIAYALATIGIRSTTGGPGTNLIAYVHLQAS